MGYKCQVCGSKSDEAKECCGAPMIEENGEEEEIEEE